MSYIVKFTDTERSCTAPVYVRFDEYPGPDVISDIELAVMNCIDVYDRRERDLSGFIEDLVADLNCEVIKQDKEVLI